MSDQQATWIDEKTIFVQLAEKFENDILRGVLAEGARVPSARALAISHGISPGTAVRCYALLLSDQVVVKRRGIGLFVEIGARERIRDRRIRRFHEDFVVPLIAEADAVGLTAPEVGVLLITASNSAHQLNPPRFGQPWDSALPPHSSADHADGS